MNPSNKKPNPLKRLKPAQLAPHLQEVYRQTERLSTLKRALSGQLTDAERPHLAGLALARQHWVIFTDSPAWSARFRYYQTKFSRILNTHPQGAPLRVKIRTLPEEETQRVPLPAPRPSRLGAECLESYSRLLESKSPELSEALARLAQKLQGDSL